MRKQSLFIENSCCFVTQSKAKAVKITPHSRSRLCPGQGAYVGGRGFAKDTELFYSGLIFHGAYNENLMLEAWTRASQIPLPEDWRGKVFMVKSQELYIIGNPESWTSALNFPGHNSSYHASIIGQTAIIKFDHAAFSFEEIFVDYAEHLTLTSHPALHSKRKFRVAAAITPEEISQETAQGERLLTEAMSEALKVGGERLLTGALSEALKVRYNTGEMCDQETLSLLAQETPSTEKDWHWHQEEKTKFDLGFRQRKKANRASGSAILSLDASSLPSTTPMSSSSALSSNDSSSSPSTTPCLSLPSVDSSTSSSSPSTTNRSLRAAAQSLDASSLPSTTPCLSLPSVDSSTKRRRQSDDNTN